MGALQYVDVPGYAALILRRTFPELEGSEGLISQSLEWLGPHRPAVHWNSEKHRWTFPSGATIQFGHMESEADKTRYQGQAYQFVGFDELTHFTESQYDYLFTRSRRRTGMRDLGIPIRIRSASNPGGIGHAWVKSRFISNRQEGVTFVPAKLRDNPGLDAEDYKESFKNVPEALRQQLLDGDWGAFEGAAFRVSKDHVVEPFPLAAPWQRFESMDHGISNPTAWLVHAVDHEGNIISFDEHYAPALPSETAPIILRKRQAWGSSHCFGDPASLATRTGTHRRWGEPATIETEYLDHGLAVVKGKSDPRTGYARLRELLKLDPERRFPDWHPRRGELGSPRWFIFEKTCPHLVEQLRSAPLTPIEHRYAGEMIDPKWEGAHGHALAAARYGLVSWPEASPLPQQPYDPRARLLAAHERKVESQQEGMSYEFV